MKAQAPYADNTILALKLEQSPDSQNQQQQSELRVRVKCHTEPWTLSCGMVVEVVDYPQDGPSRDLWAVGQKFFLKIFDRRFAHQHRHDNGVGPWSQQMEDDYMASVLSGKTDQFLHRLRTEENFQEETEEEWDNAENEASLNSQLVGLFSAETKTYERLREYQGSKIPRLFARVTLDISLHSSDASSHVNSMAGRPGHYSLSPFQIPGILIEYLQGFPMSSMAGNVPRASWQTIVDEAVAITHLLGDAHVLNTDVRPENFMIVPVEEGKHYRVCMIDFGQCRLRGPDESDEDWGRDKWVQDEEGAVGAVMKMKLEQLGFVLSYQPSLRYLPWAPGEDD